MWDIGKGAKTNFSEINQGNGRFFEKEQKNCHFFNFLFQIFKAKGSSSEIVRITNSKIKITRWR